MGLNRAINKSERLKIYSDKELLSRYLHLLIPFKRSILLISSFILISTVVDIILPPLIGFVVDYIRLPETSYTMIILLGVIYVVLSSLLWVMFSLRRREIGRFVPFFLENLRMDVFTKVQEQDMSFHDKHLSGNLNSRISNDAMDFGNMSILLADTLGNLLVSLVTFCILLYLNTTLALLTLAAVPFLFILMFSLRRLARRVSRAYRKSIANINIAMVESIEGIQTCKSFGQETTVSDQFHETNKEYFWSLIRMTAVTHVWRSVLQTITAFALIVVVFTGAHMISEGVESPGTIITFILYIQTFFGPIMVLATFLPEVSAGMAAYERILEILDTKSKVDQNRTGRTFEGIEESIEFRDVDFRYKEGEWVFQGFNLTIKRGEKLAIVGHTGSGKSSLIKLLTRFYEYQGGSITIDGVDIREFNLESYRKGIGMVQQDVFLFSGTIEENIRYGSPNATEKELWDAIRAVYAEEFIEYLPDGLQTHIGERGRGLSMGQKQLISFARAILSNPQILILDEATGSVDAYTEAVIQEALETLMEDRTSVVIAHRLSTIQNADRIIVLKRGVIVEEGTHQDLIDKGDYYKTLYETYYRHQALDLSNEL